MMGFYIWSKKKWRQPKKKLSNDITSNKEFLHSKVKCRVERQPPEWAKNICELDIWRGTWVWFWLSYWLNVESPRKSVSIRTFIEKILSKRTHNTQSGCPSEWATQIQRGSRKSKSNIQPLLLLSYSMDLWLLLQSTLDIRSQCLQLCNMRST